MSTGVKRHTVGVHGDVSLSIVTNVDLHSVETHVAGTFK